MKEYYYKSQAGTWLFLGEGIMTRERVYIYISGG
jgi:hypothetical protein